MNAKVSNYNIMKNLQTNNLKYKTQLCKHFNTPQGCSYGDKCQFAHGQQELRHIEGNGNMIPQNLYMNNKTKDALNYKIVKCKNWEKDKTCKYGAHCTFAHGDSELRNKTDNLMNIQSNMGMGLMLQPMMMDMNAMMQMNPQMQGMQGMPMIIDPTQMMNMGNMGMPAIPNNMMNNNPGMQDLNNNEEKKGE